MENRFHDSDFVCGVLICDPKERQTHKKPNEAHLARNSLRRLDENLEGFKVGKDSKVALSGMQKSCRLRNAWDLRTFT